MLILLYVVRAEELHIIENKSLFLLAYLGIFLYLCIKVTMIKFMKITKDYILSRHAYFNGRYFNGRLTTPEIKLTNGQRLLGTYRQKYLYGSKYSFITISTFWDLSEYVLDNVILHEMIHQYITENSIQDNRTHGREFMAKAEEINRDGWNIKRLTNTMGAKPKISKPFDVFIFPYKDYYVISRYSQGRKRDMKYTLGKMGIDATFLTIDDPKYIKIKKCVSRIHGKRIDAKEYKRLKAMSE